MCIMINRLVNEIEIALKNNLYMVALNTALTLPDICGKAEFPDKSNKKNMLSGLIIILGNMKRLKITIFHI